MGKSIIGNITEGFNKGKAQFEDIIAGTATGESTEHTASELCRGDNLEYMKRLLERGYAGRLRLIYIDPPFFTRSSFNASVTLRDAEGTKHSIHHLAYDDKFDRSLEYYIENMTVRLLMMRELLADDGLMWVHLDWHSSHYVKLVMDEIMGEKNFVNEIIWCYKSGGSSSRHFARKHDSILVYSKTGSYCMDVPLEKSYNREFKAYKFKGVDEYRDEAGWYTMVKMKDVWNIDMVGRTSAERTGYATQKPLELTKRIIESCTSEGDLVGDFFCGSGSFLEAAEILGRKWIGCDSEALAVSVSRMRLSGAGAQFDCLQTDNETLLHGRAGIRVISKDPLEDGRYLYKCVLTDLVPDINIGSIRLSDRRHIDRVLKESRLQFARYIIIYPCEEGHGGEKIISGDLSDIIFIAGDSFEAVVTDVFGKEYSADIDFASSEG